MGLFEIALLLIAARRRNAHTVSQLLIHLSALLLIQMQTFLEPSCGELFTRVACLRLRYWILVIKSLFHGFHYPILSLDVTENLGCPKCN